MSNLIKSVIPCASGSNSGGGGTSAGLWELAAPGTPAAGFVSFDNANPTLATELQISETRKDGKNVGATLATYQQGAHIYVRVNSAEYVILKIDTNTQAGGVYTFTGTVTPGPDALVVGEDVNIITDQVFQDPQAISDSLDLLYGYKNWRGYPEDLWIENNADLGPGSATFLTDLPSVYPDGYNLLNAKKAKLTEGIQTQYPIVMAGGAELIGGSIEYNGPTGRGPLGFEDAFLTISNTTTIESTEIKCRVTGVAGRLVNAQTLIERDVVSNCTKPYAYYGSIVHTTNGITNWVQSQTTPSTFNNTAGATISLKLDGFVFGDTGGFGGTSDSFDGTGADAAASFKVDIIGANVAMESTTNVFFRVTDDNTITEGAISGNTLSAASTGGLINLTDKSLNSFFSGNSQNIGNTFRRGMIIVQDNALETNYQGQNVPTPLVFDNVSGSLADSGWRVNPDGTLEYINPNADFYGNFDWNFGITKVGGGANEVTLYIYKQSTGGAWAILSEGTTVAKSSPLTVESNDEVEGIINYPVVATFGDKFAGWASINSPPGNPDNIKLISLNGGVL